MTVWARGSTWKCAINLNLTSLTNSICTNLDNDTHKLLLNFDIHSDHLISARRSDFKILNKTRKICQIVNFAVTPDHRIKLKECEKRDNYLDFARKLKKL